MNDKEKGTVYAIMLIDHVLTRIFNIIAIIAPISLILVMMMAVIDVVGGKLFKHSLAMAYEATQMLSIPIVFLAVGSVQFGRGAMSIELVKNRLPKAIQNVINTLYNLLGFFLSVFISWRAGIYMLFMIEGGTRTTGSTRILQWPFAGILAFGWACMALGFLFCLIRMFLKYETLPDLSPSQMLREIEDE